VSNPFSPSATGSRGHRRPLVCTGYRLNIRRRSQHRPRAVAIAHLPIGAGRTERKPQSLTPFRPPLRKHNALSDRQVADTWILRCDVQRSALAVRALGVVRECIQVQRMWRGFTVAPFTVLISQSIQCSVPFFCRTRSSQRERPRTCAVRIASRRNGRSSAWTCASHQSADMTSSSRKPSHRVMPSLMKVGIRNPSSKPRR